jgi:molybdopterin-guanine dinucleotide biosynthesis protein A
MTTETDTPGDGTFGRDVNCYILTGGQSARMGRSKAEMFLDAVAAAARGVFDEVIAVERAGGPQRSIATIFEEKHEHDGAVFGVARALEHAESRAFILAVDYAHITAPVLLDLRRRVERSNASVVIPVWRGIPQTLCGGYARSLLPLIEERIAQGRLDLIGLAAYVRAEMFTYDAPELKNVNRPADLERTP